MKCTCDTLAPDTIECASTCISDLWIFENIAPQEFEALISSTERRQFRADELIFRQGEPANQMFLIKAGRVKLGKVTQEGNEITLDIRQAGDFLGENSLSEDIDFPVTATCMEDTFTCGFSRSGFEKLVLEFPNIGLHVIRNLSKRIEWLTSRVGSMSYSHIEDRLYQVLLSVAREHGRKNGAGFAIPMPFTHEDLAFLVGAHRVSVTRAMKDLKQAGRIIQEGKTLIVSEAESA